MNKLLVLYHFKNLNNIAGEWAVEHFTDNVELVPVNYCESIIPDVTGRDVVLVDFTLNPRLFAEIKNKAKSVLVLDHLKVSQNYSQDVAYCVFDMANADNNITHYFFSEGILDSLPLLHPTDDLDLLEWSHPYTKEIFAALFGGKKSSLYKLSDRTLLKMYSKDVKFLSNNHIL